MQSAPQADMTTLVTGAFSGGFVRRRVPMGYHLGMLLVLLALLILPLLYLALIAGMGWLLAWHVQHDVVWITGASEMRYGSGKAVLLAGFLYLAVAVAGAICILFMIKPLFAPLPKQPPTVTLDPISQPALFALIHRICDLVGAPRPVVVEVDAQVNASASFRRGMASFFGHDLVLSIGMPLVAGLTARQLAGVLAHEFGHFAQSGGMRLGYLVKSINHWFARIVLEHDGWDDRLETLCSREGYIGTMGSFARIMIWMGRKVLGLLMLAGGAISGFMARQKEYDADVYAAQVAGSEGFCAGLLQLELLGVAEETVILKAQNQFRQGTLPENVPGRIACHEREMTEDVRKRLKKEALAQEASWWSTHPSTNDRLEKVKEMEAQGVFHLDAPAADLFCDFTGLCKTVSLYWYDVELGLDLDDVELVDVDHVEQMQAENKKRAAQEMEDQQSAARQAEEQGRKEQQREEAMREMFGHAPPAYRLMPVPMATAEQWEQAAAVVKAWKSDYAGACEHEKKLREVLCRRTLACHTLHLRQAMAGPEAPAVLSAQAQALGEHETMSQQMAVFEQAAWTRIAAALAGHFSQARTPPAWRDQVGLLVEAQRALAAAMQHLTAVCVEALWLAQHAREAAANVRQEYETRVHAGVSHAVRALGTTANPYDQERRPLALTLGQSCADAAETYAKLKNNLCHYANSVTRDLCLLAHEVELAKEMACAPQIARAGNSPAWQPAGLAVAA